MPNYTYTLLLQKLNASESAKDDKLLLSDFHSILRDFAEHQINEKKKNNSESIQRAISRLRGSLIPYLSTPLKSDTDDIERSIKDTIDDVLSQGGYSTENATLTTEMFQILEPSQIQLHRQLVGVIKRLLKNGKAMLTDAGIQSGKNAGGLYLFRFSFEGFQIVTTLRQAVERAKGKYNHSEIGICNDALTENIVTHTQDAANTDFTILLYFDAGAEVVEKLKRTLPALLNQFGVSSIQLNKRLFYAGMGSEYQLQFTSNLKKHPLGTILLAVIGEDSELEEAITEQGSLIVVEKIT
ncbi:MAG: hypothetical protein AB1728_12645 [Bacteroidota bacterium]